MITKFQAHHSAIAWTYIAIANFQNIIDVLTAFGRAIGRLHN